MVINQCWSMACGIAVVTAVSMVALQRRRCHRSADKVDDGNVGDELAKWQ